MKANNDKKFHSERNGFAKKSLTTIRRDATNGQFILVEKAKKDTKHSVVETIIVAANAPNHKSKRPSDRAISFISSNYVKKQPINKIPNIHAGEILLEEFLKPLNLSASKLANETALSEKIICDICAGKSSVTNEIAQKLSQYFGNSQQFWLGLQRDYDCS